MGDRKTDQNIQIYQNGVFMPILTWWAADGVMDTTYASYDVSGWDGVIWAGGSTDVSAGV